MMVVLYHRLTHNVSIRLYHLDNLLTPVSCHYHDCVLLRIAAADEYRGTGDQGIVLPAYQLLQHNVRPDRDGNRCPVGDHCVPADPDCIDLRNRRARRKAVPHGNPALWQRYCSEVNLRQINRWCRLIPSRNHRFSLSKYLGHSAI